MASKKDIEDAAKHGHSVAEHQAHKWLLGGAAVAGSVVAAPYLLPTLGIGQSLALPASQTHFIMGNLAAPSSAGAMGSGLAGAIQGGIANIPGIGGILTSQSLVTIPGIGVQVASGALATLALAGGLAIGGMFLANHLEKNEDKNAKGIKWSKVVRYGSLATSMLISLPSLLTGLSVGIAFIAAQFGGQALLSTLSTLRDTIGATTMATSGATGIGGFAALVPHLFTCGAASLPVIGSMFFGNGNKHAEHQHGNASPETAPVISLQNQTPLQPNTQNLLQFQLRDRKTGAILTPNDLTTTHTEKLHTMVVNSSLTDYHHVHPSYNPHTQTWDAVITPNTNEPYTSWHDTTLNTEHAPHHVQVPLPAPINSRVIPANIMHQQHANVGDYQARFNYDKPLKAGKTNTMIISMHDKYGQPIEHFTSIMGADAHLVGFSADGSHFVHCHPSKTEGNKLHFHIHPEHAGGTRFFLQARPNGKDITVPMDQFIQPARNMPNKHAGFAAKVQQEKLLTEQMARG